MNSNIPPAASACARDYRALGWLPAGEEGLQVQKLFIFTQGTRAHTLEEPQWHVCSTCMCTESAWLAVITLHEAPLMEKQQFTHGIIILFYILKAKTLGIAAGISFGCINNRIGTDTMVKYSWSTIPRHWYWMWWCCLICVCNAVKVRIVTLF